MSETPDWFWKAVETETESGYVEVEDVDIHFCEWSPVGNPGLLFVHGHNAHAHWWDFIAPAFKDAYQTVALDLSGMGDSDHRDEYSADLYAAEILGVADKTKLPENTIVVAHSFGGIMGLRTLAKHANRFKGLILLDSGVKHPDDDKPRDPERWSKPKVYPDIEVAKSRFRLQPPQTCDNDYIVQHIARHSVEFNEDADGFVWKFDEELGSRMQATGDIVDDLKSLTCKVALIYGDNSESFSAKSAEYMKELQPNLEVYALKDAQHHLFLDQPEAFMAQLNLVLDDWA